ncbi:PAS domain S-box protein [Kamptonema formosum]|uniref:PAS domain S-box protein n=1 Tax=Kamptonema formosum TaxID=331992 RepID=UPI0003450776|nr:PAS domain S-box protein [Oscillatoria sp. PCC 10802]
MLKLRPSQLHPYAVPILLVTLISLLDLALAPKIAIESPFLLFFAGVMASARSGGWAGGSLATVLAAVAIDCWFLTPTNWPLAHTPGQNLGLALFVLEGLWVSRAIGGLPQSQGRAEAVGELEDGESVGESQQRDTGEGSGAAGGARRSESALRSYFNLSPIGIAITSPEFGWLEFNDRLCDMLGYSRQELVQVTWPEITHPQDLEADLQQFNRVLAGESEGYSMEKRFVGKNGQLIRASITVQCVRSRSGSVDYFLAVVQDITERTRTLEALRKSETRYRQLSRATKEAIWDWDLVTNKVMWNENLETLFGYSAGAVEIDANWWCERIHPEDRERVVKGIHDAIDSGGEIWSDEYRFRRADNSYAQVIDRGFIAHDEKGQPVQMLGSMADITERVQASETLHRSQQEFKALIENTPDLVMRLDRDHRYVYVNPEVERLTGMPAETFIGKRSEELGQPEELCRLWNETMRKVFETGQKQEIEYRNLTADGLRTYQSRAVPEFDKEGSPRYALVVIRDITEMRQAEEKRAQLIREQAARAQAEESNRMKDQFLAILSHELRTPLTAILGWVRLLLNQKFDEKKLAHGLHTIERNAQLQAQLVNDILDISQIIKGKIVLNAQPTDLAAGINAAIESVRLAAEAKSISVTPALDVSVRPVLGDAERLQQVVWNLLSNAIKFTPSGGRVEVRLSCAGSCAQIGVSDTGCGISPEFLPHVFDLFRQADSSNTRAYGGLGLGLAIVRHLVELHGGSVCAESGGVGRGATFTVSLPLLKSASLGERGRQGNGKNSPSHSLTPSFSRSLTGLRVLVVDDEPDIREVLTVVLEQYGAEVTAVGSAGEAIAALARKVPDVLVSDIGMPVEDGYTLIRKVRDLEIELGGEIPALALTAYAREEERRRAIAAGFHMHVPKPVESAKLAEAIASLAQLKVKN